MGEIKPEMKAASDAGLGERGRMCVFLMRIRVLCSASPSANIKRHCSDFAHFSGMGWALGNHSPKKPKLSVFLEML